MGSEGLGAPSGQYDLPEPVGSRPGKTVVSKAPEEARQQRCGQGPGDLGRFWEGCGVGWGERWRSEGGAQEQEGAVSDSVLGGPDSEDSMCHWWQHSLCDQGHSS